MAKTPAPTPIAEPAKTRVFVIGETPTEVTMSFGLLNILARMCGDAQGALMVSMDNDLREAILVSVLSTRDKRGQITDDGEFSLFESEITTEQAMEVAAWAADHLLPFFLKAAQQTQSVVVKNQGAIEELKSQQSTLTGLES